ncbi:MAG: hypothetical protein WBV82_06525 [Myxococcaceae bacterium]
MRAFGIWGSGTEVWVVGHLSGSAPNFSSIVRWDGDDCHPEDTGDLLRDADGGLLGLNDVWGLRPDAIWAVGEQGTILRRDGNEWVREASPTGEDLNAIYGTSSGDLWAVGNAGTLIRRAPDTEWIRVSIDAGGENLLGVYAVDPENIWIVGENGSIYDRAKGAWRRRAVAANSLNAVWGTGPEEVWAVGSAGQMHLWDGQMWKLVPTGSSQTIFAIHGNSRGVWIGGWGGSILKKNRN